MPAYAARASSRGSLPGTQGPSTSSCLFRACRSALDATLSAIPASSRQRMSHAQLERSARPDANPKA